LQPNPMLTVSVDGLDTPDKETNSSEVEAFDAISTAPARVLAPVPVCGVNPTVTAQLAPTINVPQLVDTGKSAVLWTPLMVRVALPVFVTVICWGVAALPTAVSAKLIELGDVVSVITGPALDGEFTNTGVDVPVRLT